MNSSLRLCKALEGLASTKSRREVLCNYQDSFHRCHSTSALKQNNRLRLLVREFQPRHVAYRRLPRSNQSPPIRDRYTTPTSPPSGKRNCV